MKNRKYKFCVILLLLGSLGCIDSLFSQTLIRGLVKDITTKEPIPYGYVFLYNLNDSLAITGAEVADGSFNFKTSVTGQKMLKISIMGYQDSSFMILIPENKELNLGTILLKSEESKTVEIVARKPTIEVKNGVLTVFVENSPLYQSGTAWELIEKVPGVLASESGITYKGQANIAVYIDGQKYMFSTEQLQAYLASMPATDIVKVEVSSTSSARYDASAQGGVIHIYTKKTKKEGLNGEFYVLGGWGKSYRTINRFLLGYKTAKWNVSANYAYTNNKFEKQRDAERILLNQNTVIGYLTQEIPRISVNQYHNYRLNAEFTPNEKHTLGINANGFNRNLNETLISNNIAKNGQAEALYEMNTQNKSERKVFNPNVGLYYSWKPDTSTHYFSFAANWLPYNSAQQDNIQSFYLYPTLSPIPSPNKKVETETNTDIKTLQADYSYPFHKVNLRLDLGAKYSHTVSTNKIDFQSLSSKSWENIAAFSNYFKYSEQISSAYIDLTKDIHKWSFNIGSRIENTNAKGFSYVQNKYILDTQYVNLFPYLSVSYDIKKDLNLNLNANRTLMRPGYRDLDPFVQYIDSFSYYKGNPLLVPQFKNAASLTLTYKQYASLSVELAQTQKPYGDFVTQYATSSPISVLSVQNFKQLRYWGVQAMIPIPAVSWWRIMNVIGINKKSFYYGIENVLPQSAVLWYAVNYNEFTFKKQGLNLVLSSRYNSAGINDIFRFKPIFNMDFSIKKNLFKDKASITIEAKDIWNTNQLRVNANIPNVRITGQDFNDIHVINIAFRYYFGWSPENKVLKTSNTNESNRIKDN